MIIIETKTNVHIFQDRELDHVEYNIELSNVLVYFTTEGYLDGKKKMMTFEDVLNMRYITNACPKPYEFKSSEQARLMRELEERRKLDHINYLLTRTLCAACESLQKGDYKAKHYEKDINQMFEERSEIYKRIDEIGKVITNNDKRL